MGSPPSLDLGATNITPFMVGLFFTRACVWSLVMGMGRFLGTQLHSTRGSASTHYVPNLNLIKGIFNMLF